METTNRDFYMTAYLLSSGCKLKSYVRKNGITFFTFDENSDIEKLSNDFYSNKATVNPITYSNAIRNLKSIIHSGEVLL